MGVYVYNTDASGSAPTTKTKNSIVNNTISNSRPRTSPATALRRLPGRDLRLRQQDNIVNNKVSGIGYDPTLADGSVSRKLDITGSTNPHVNNNG